MKKEKGKNSEGKKSHIRCVQIVENSSLSLPEAFRDQSTACAPAEIPSLARLKTSPRCDIEVVYL